MYTGAYTMHVDRLYSFVRLFDAHKYATKLTTRLTSQTNGDMTDNLSVSGIWILFQSLTTDNIDKSADYPIHASLCETHTKKHYI